MPIAIHYFPTRDSSARRARASQMSKIDVHLIAPGGVVDSGTALGCMLSVVCGCTHRQGAWCGARARPRAGRARGGVRPRSRLPAPAAAAHAARRAAWRRSLSHGRSRVLTDVPGHELTIRAARARSCGVQRAQFASSATRRRRRSATAEPDWAERRAISRLMRRGGRRAPRGKRGNRAVRACGRGKCSAVSRPPRRPRPARRPPAPPEQHRY